MSEAPKRRNLLAVAATTPDPLPQDTIAAVATRNGFPSAAATAPEAPTDSSLRRRRQPTGRDHQFNTRLRRDTLDFIYAQANERNIPVAQVIEEATEALKQQQLRRP
jgi:hypothetical protein